MKSTRYNMAAARVEFANNSADGGKVTGRQLAVHLMYTLNNTLVDKCMLPEHAATLQRTVVNGNSPLIDIL